MEYAPILTPILHSLGWTIIHSIWQVALLAGLAAIALRFIPGKQANTRYWVAFSALSLSLMSLIFTFGWYYFQTELVGTPVAIVGESSSAVFLFSDLPNVIGGTSLTDWLDQHSWLLGIFWLVGFSLMSVRYSISYVLVRRLRSQKIGEVPAIWRDKFQALLQAAGIERAVEFKTSLLVHNPLTIGHLKPLILVPAGFFMMLSPEQAEAVLLHEIAHIKRNDYLFNLIQTFIALVLFYHPAAWFLSKCIDTERENACDDFALGHTGNPQAFARALSYLQLHYFKTQNQMAMHFLKDKNSVLNRLKRIVNPGFNPTSSRSSLRLLLPLLILLFGTSLIAFSQLPEEVETLETDGIEYSVETPTSNDLELMEEEGFVEEPVEEATAEPLAATLEEPLETVASEPLMLAYFSEPKNTLDTFPDKELKEELNRTQEEMLKMEKEMAEMQKEYEAEMLQMQKEMSEEVTEEMKEAMREMEEELKEAMKEAEMARVELMEESTELEEEARELREEQAEEMREAMEEAEEEMREAEEEMREARAEMEEEVREAMEEAREEMEEAQEEMREAQQEMEEAQVEMREAQEEEVRWNRFRNDLIDYLVEDGFMTQDGERVTVKMSNALIEVDGKQLDSGQHQKYINLFEQFDMEAGDEVRIKVGKNNLSIDVND